MHPSLDEIVSRVDDLPALPQVVAKVLQLTDDPNSTVKELSEVICQDQVLTAKVLRLANSAYYGYPRRIGTIVEAIVMLGFKAIRNLVMAASVQKILYQSVAGYRLEAGDLWRHSIACAMAAHKVAKRVGYNKSDEAFIAGLLHDIGKVVLNVYVNEAYGEIVKRVKDLHVSFSQAEKDVIGFTHADVGARVVDKWNLPKQYVEAIAYHHEPELGKENPRLVAIVHLADVMCMMMGIGLGGDGLYYAVSSEAFSVLGLRSLDVENILEELGDLFIDTDAFDPI
ncbi:MAG: HDOD domain-containing protein [Thermacetogeniaceae bacterium]